MFTGLVEDVGTVQQLQHRAPQSVLLLRCGRLDPATLVLGESIAVNGACLTVSSRTGGGFAAEASPETLARTTLGGLRPGERVHLERALRLGDRLGGHLVLGHVDGVGRVARIEQQGELRRLSVHCPPELRRLLVGKGSVAVDGVSLTVNELTPDGFTVVIIPHTGKVTLLAEKKAGDPVNLEGDILGKYVLSALERGLFPSSDVAAGATVPGGGVAGAGAADERLRRALEQAGLWSAGHGDGG